MDLIDVAAVLLSLAALFGYVNHRFFKLPATIGMMVITLTISAVLLIVDNRFPDIGLGEMIRSRVGAIEFHTTLLHGMLSFLLFAGALHINLDELLERKWAIGSLATLGVALSTLIVGGCSYLFFGLLDLSIPLMTCLVFGALISPTDPVAVLGVLKNANAPPTLKAKIAGESLFNDGVGLVVFILLVSAAGLRGEQTTGAGPIALLFVQEAVGGALLGLVLGFVAYRAVKSIDQYQVELTITLALVVGTNSLAEALHLSGPIAVVVAGLLIGNQGRNFAMSDVTVDHLEKFWSLLDDILNGILFLMLGLELFRISLDPLHLAAGAVMIVIVLASRFISVGIPITLLKAARRTFSPGVVRILTWSGLRGGISVALVLSLPDFEGRDLMITCTYMVVLFSVIVQGLTIKNVVRRSLAKGNRL